MYTYVYGYGMVTILEYVFYFVEVVFSHQVNIIDD